MVSFGVSSKTPFQGSKVNGQNRARQGRPCILIAANYDLNPGPQRRLNEGHRTPNLNSLRPGKQLTG